jgi:hypothetical protein
MSNKNENNNGMSFLGVLTLIFIVLKLTGSIAWSWWWVLCPLWAPFAIFLVIFPVFSIYRSKLLKKQDEELNQLRPGKVHRVKLTKEQEKEEEN